MSKASLTTQEIAALAAATAGVAAPAAAAAAAAQTESTAAAVETPVAEAAPAAAAAPAQVTEAEKGKIELLTAQLATKDSELLQARVDLKVAQDRLAPLEASIKPLAAIVATSVSNMKVALGLSAVDLSALAPEQLVAEHTATADTFVNKFKAGGVAAVPAAETPQDKADVVPAHHKALINATRFTK
jgi:hypothetical protein